LSSRVTFRAVLVSVMGLVLAAYVGGLVLQSQVSSPIVDGGFNPLFGLAAHWVPVAVCWLAVSRVGFRRPEILLAAAAVTSFAAWGTYRIVIAAGGGLLPFPSPGDATYLLFYPLMFAALALTIRSYVRGLASSVWWDSAVGFLGAAAVLAVVVGPALGSALTGSPSIATAVAVAYPVLDLLLVAAVAAVAAVAMHRIRMDLRWVLLIAGLLVLAAAHVVYAHQVTANTYVVGSLLDGVWPVGLALVALWIDGAASSDGSATQPETSVATGATALLVPVVATAAALGVLVVGTRAPLSILAVALAFATVLAAGARALVAFRKFAPTADPGIQATTDELTGLPNRRTLALRVRARLVDHASPRALLLLDLDKFEEVNESLGRHAGDKLMAQVGARLSEQVRDGDLLARLGSDEFAILLEDADYEQAAAVAVKLRSALAEPFELSGVAPLHSGVSIGIALFPEQGRDLSTLLRKADIAMSKAKTSGSGHHFYTDTDIGGGKNTLHTVTELQTAMTSDQLVLHYQPKIDLDTGNVHSVEALVRWEHPTRGLLYPEVFSALAEEAGLTHIMTRLVLEMALDQAAVWKGQGKNLTIAVNVSARSLVDDADLPDEVAAMLDARDLGPGALKMAITEEFLTSDRDRALKMLTRLRKGGVQISVCDFGTADTSLSYLRDLPIDELKLDRSFVMRLAAGRFETKVAYTELTRLGSDQTEGYYMSRPVPAAELDHWLNTRDGDADKPPNISPPLPAAAPQKRGRWILPVNEATAVPPAKETATVPPVKETATVPPG
jgi:diguanylate cyclase (GGDEF)-like protein